MPEVEIDFTGNDQGLNDEIKKVNSGLSEMDKTVETVGKSDQKLQGFKASWTEINSAIGVTKEVLAVAKQAFDETVGAAVDYANEVRAVQEVSGLSADASSRLIQMADDYKVSLQDLMATQRELNKDGKTMSVEFLANTADN